ncbi:hypothetical protein C8F04DRAFT_1174842 [Mycena alexandri]|uniref:Uncharacterized protein n=1 Tax=Mycena alexandri TaxID=1745969 RepID=A0AAD6TFG9_9AGAR|nr:hypothetical protein C8F04DRAFT_1174842 [Mycena alexandri]
MTIREMERSIVHGKICLGIYQQLQLTSSLCLNYEVLVDVEVEPGSKAAVQVDFQGDFRVYPSAADTVVRFRNGEFCSDTGLQSSSHIFCPSLASSCHPSSISEVSPPMSSPSPKFPICHELNIRDDRDRKTVLRPLVETRIRRTVLRLLNPLPRYRIRPSHVPDGDHLWTGVKLHVGKPDIQRIGRRFQVCIPKHHPDCNICVHVCAEAPPAVAGHPTISRLLAAREEVTETPRPPRMISHSPPNRGTSGSSSSSSSPFPALSQTRRDNRPTPYRRCNTRFGPPLEEDEPPLPAMVMHGPIDPPLLPMAIQSISRSPSSSSIVAPILGLNYPYSPDGHILLNTPSMSSHSAPAHASDAVDTVAGEVEVEGAGVESADDVLDGTSSTVVGRATSIISVSSDSSSDKDDLELQYPPEPVVHIDLLTPIRLYVLLDGNAPFLILHDYQQALAHLGYDTNGMGELYLQHGRQWLAFAPDFPLPIINPNNFLFLRAHNANTLSPDDLLGSIFKS